MNNATVAFLDVLGWKGIWQRKEDPVAPLLAIVERARARHSTLQSETEKNLFVERFGKAHLDVLLISDTLVVVSKDSHDVSLPYISFVCANIVCDGLREGYPIRGAITHGKLDYTSNTLVGPAIDEVASWYEEANWVGVHLCPGAYFKIHGQKVSLGLLIKDYQVPLASGSVYGIKAINWAFNWMSTEKDYVLRRRKLIEHLLETAPLIPSVGIKMANTLKFYDAMLPEVIKLDAFIDGKGAPPPDVYLG